MTKIKDIPTALSLFEETAMKHAEATKKGDYKVGNKNYHKKIKVISYLKEHNSIGELLSYLDHDNVGIRLSAATYLLRNYEKEAIRVLEEIAQSTDFFSFTAQTTLNEWRKGNLKL